jgi:hypothetical protein
MNITLVFMKSLCAEPISEWLLYADSSYISRATLQQERIMSDLIYVGLGVFFFILMGAYARVCGRL